MNTNLQSMFQKDKMGLGKRKQAVARVFFVPGEGNLVINKISGEKYLQFNTVYLNKIWAPLKKLNLEEDTIIVLWGDHGFHLGEHNMWGKHNTLKNALQTPLIIKVPNRFITIENQNFGCVYIYKY